MNNQDKITTRLSKIKVHRANSLTKSSYLVRFSADIFSPLVSCLCLVLLLFYLISCLIYLSSCFILFFWFFVFSKYIYIYIYWYTFNYAGGWVISHLPISVNKTTFFGLILFSALETIHQVRMLKLGDFQAPSYPL